MAFCPDCLLFNEECFVEEKDWGKPCMSFKRINADIEDLGEEVHEDIETQKGGDKIGKTEGR